MDGNIEWLEGRFGEQDLVAQKWDHVLSVVLNGTLNGKSPNWHEVLVVDRPFPDEGQSAVPADTFEKRWEEILHLGYADWVNVERPNISDGHLIIEVVYAGAPYVPHGTSTMRRCRRDTIWVELYVMDPSSSNYRFPYEIWGEKTKKGQRSDS